MSNKQITITATEDGVQIHTIRVEKRFDPKAQKYTPVPVGQRCQHTMTIGSRGTYGGRAASKGSYTKGRGKKMRCPKGASIQVNGVWYCSGHAPD